MAWLQTVPESEARGELAEVYAKYKQRGFVPNVYKALSLRPDMLDAVERLTHAGANGGTSLTRIQEEMIATVVSSINHCHY